MEVGEAVQETSEEANEDEELVSNVVEDNIVVDKAEPGNSRRSSQSKKPKILTFHEKKLLGLMGPDAVQYLR